MPLTYSMLEEKLSQRRPLPTACQSRPCQNVPFVLASNVSLPLSDRTSHFCVVGALTLTERVFFFFFCQSEEVGQVVVASKLIFFLPAVFPLHVSHAKCFSILVSPPFTELKFNFFEKKQTKSSDKAVPRLHPAWFYTRSTQDKKNAGF